MYQKSQQTRHTKKLPKFPTFHALKITFMCTCDFCRYEHVYRNLKTFLEENCVIALDICYLFTRKCWIEHDTDSVCLWSFHTLGIHFRTLQQIRWTATYLQFKHYGEFNSLVVYNIIRCFSWFFFNFLCGSKFLT